MKKEWSVVVKYEDRGGTWAREVSLKAKTQSIAKELGRAAFLKAGIPYIKITNIRVFFIRDGK